MSLKHFFTILVCFTCIRGYSQSEEKTYFDTYFEGLALLGTDSSKLDISTADSLFQELFSANKNQLEDVDYVIGRLKKLNYPVHESYYKAQIRESKNYLNYKLQTTDAYRMKRSTYRKLSKEVDRPKKIKKKRTVKLWRMLHKDQRARRKNNIEKRFEIDSLNAIEIKAMLQDSVYIKELGFFNRSFFELILLHGGWDNYKDQIELIRQYIDKRYLNRAFFSEIFERKAIGNGVLFTFSNNELSVCSDCSQKLCTKSPMFPSNTGNRQYYINGQHVFVPINPNLTIDELNRFRRYCFLPHYTTKSTNERILFPTIAEWCLLNNDL